MEKIGSICILNRGGLPLKKGPLRIYGLIDVSGSIPLFRSMYPRFKCADGPLFIFFLEAWLYKASIPWKRLGPSAF